MSNPAEIIKEHGKRRLARYVDMDYDIENLKGDTYNPKAHPDMSREQLEEEERAFEQRIDRDGVWGYVVEEWDARVGGGWVHIDSIWGFVGDDFNGSGYDIEMLAAVGGSNV